MGDDEDQLSRFLAMFPNKVYSVSSYVDPDKRRVFFSLIERKPKTQRNLSSSSLSSADVSAARWFLHEWIKSAFKKFNRCPHKGLLVQFWAPRKLTSGWKFRTLDEPFVLDHLDPRHQEYRLWCIDENNLSDDVLTHSAYLPFLDSFPGVIVDLENHRGCPLVDKAVECGFGCQIMLPVYRQKLTKSFCVGFVECCLGLSSLPGVFNELRSAVESVGLGTRCINPRPEPNPGLEAAKHEIKRALQMVCEGYHLALAQVWIPYDVEHVPLSLSSFPTPEEEKNPSPKVGKFIIKLCGYRFDDFDVGFSSMVKDYCDACDVLPYQAGMGFVGKTLMTYKPRFCKNMGKLSRNERFGFLSLLSDRTQCSCIVICLRSTHTGKNVDYVFEFLWPKTRNHLLVLHFLLSTLKSCLPSFMFASGAQLDGELLFEDIEHSTRRPDVIKSFEQPKALDKAALDSEGKGVKRKFDELTESVGVVQSVACADRHGEEVDDIIIVATYNYEFIIQTSYTLSNVEEKIEKEFKLDPGSYTMKYEIEGKWQHITTDQDLTCCIGLWRSGQKSRIPLHVEKT